MTIATLNSLFANTYSYNDPPLNIVLTPGTFNLRGALAEPALTMTAGTNFDYCTLDYADGATEQNAYFLIPSYRTSQYSGYNNIKVDIDLVLTGTLAAGNTIIFGIGLVAVQVDGLIDAVAPTTGTGFATGTYTIGAAESSSKLKKITVTVTADASIGEGLTWIGRLIRKTGTDTSVATARVLGVTVYE